MNRTQLLTTLRRLTSTPTAPYEELDVRDVLHALIGEHGLHFQTDAFGNTVVRVRRGMPRNKVAFVAHLDHPALRVIGKKGTQLVCKAEGGVPTLGLRNAKLIFPKCKSGPVTGKIASAKVIRAGERQRLEQAVVQIAPKGAQPDVGDFAVLDLPVFVQKGNRLRLRVADDLAGVTAVLTALADLARQDAACEAWGIFTRAEEVGFHGAVALVLGGLLPRDLTIVSVECSKAYAGIELGKGPVVRLGDRGGPFDPKAVALVAGAARALSDSAFAHQAALMAGGTCEATAFGAFGYRAAGIALPLLAYHNQGSHGVAPEEIDVRDLERAVKLIGAVSERAGAGVDDVDLLRNDLVRSSEEGRQRLRTPIVGSNSFVPEPV
jgi:putative aminopeptidase FrvX